MELPGWTYLVVGILVSGISAYVYKFVPKDGSPNNSMAVFFFVGMIFLLIGFVKLFFKKVDTQMAVKDEKYVQRIQAEHPSTISTSRLHAHHNPTQHTGSHQSVHTPMSQRIQSFTHTQPQQQTRYVIVACKKCGTKNYTHSNYCHNCGNQLSR